MTAKHNLDRTTAANATAWADDVDATVNRLSGLVLGRLTNVAGTNAITGRLPMSAGFTAISDGAIFLFLPAANNTGAATMQLQDTAGSNVGSSFGLRDTDGVAFAADAIVASRLQVFQYSSSEGYARRIADIATTSQVSGWELLETQEPTTDVATITFATDTTAYKSIRVEILAQYTNSGAVGAVQYSPDGSTWRTLGVTPAALGNNTMVLAAFEIHNVDNADGSNLRICHCVSHSNFNAALDRSSANTDFTTAGAGAGGFTSFNEVMAFFRFAVNAGSFEGSNSDQRSIARIYGQS